MPIKNHVPLFYRNILPVGFTIIILLMVTSSILTVFKMDERAKNNVKSASQQNLNSELLGSMSKSVLQRTLILVEMLQTRDPFKNDELFLELNATGTDFALARARFESQELEPRLQKLLETQAHVITINEPAINYFYELIQQENFKKAQSIFTDVTFPRITINLNLIQELTDNQYWVEQESVERSKKANEKDLAWITTINLISIIMSIILTVYIIRRQKINDKLLSVQAVTDSLTKLPNRESFIHNIEQQIKTEPDSTFAIVFFDIDYFKSINDNYGHEMGDEILKKYVHKLKSVINKTDILSRFGGDEFVLLLRNIDSKKEAEIFISELSKKLDASCVIDNNEIFLTSSIGVSVYSIDASDAKTLLKHADIAMYTAKESGRNCYQFFSLETQSKMEREHTISHALQTVIKNGNCDNELYLKYQPLLSIANNEINECEALIRWKTKDGAHIPTDEFITIAEKSNLIEKINLFVIEEACKQQKIWQKSGINNTRININLSGNKLIFAKLLKQFNHLIKVLDLSPSLFGIELTERTLLDVSDETIQSLKKCRDSGMKISIDDFGTGYSSLSYLKKLPITTIKIDQSFIAGLPEDKDDRALVKTIITLSHSLKLDVVAEGVETIAQLEFLKSHSCDIAQGYYFHHPLEHKKYSKLKMVA